MSRRHTTQGKRNAEREAVIAKRIARALRRHGFIVEHLAQFDTHGARSNGASLSARRNTYMVHFVVTLPGHKPDALQREALANDPRAVLVSAPAEALRAVSVGILAS